MISSEEYRACDGALLLWITLERVQHTEQMKSSACWGPEGPAGLDGASGGLVVVSLLVSWV